MNRKQLNQLSMGKSVLAHLDKFSESWNTQPTIPPVVEGFRITLTELFRHSRKQEENNTPGFTRTKDNELEKLIDATHLMSTRMRAFGKLNKDELVLESAKHSYSGLVRLPEQLLLQASQILTSHARNKIIDLKDFGITEENVVHLESIQTEVSKLIDQRIMAGSTRKSATELIPELLTQMRDQLDTLDYLLEGLVTDQDFLSIYDNLRRINDRGGRGTQLPSEEDIN